MKIGELAAATGVTPATLRFYEAEGLLAEPDRTPSGYRSYGAEAVGRVEFVRQAQAAGLKLDQVAQILDISERGAAPCEHVRVMVEERLAEVAARLADLSRTQRELRGIMERLNGLEPADCDQYCRAIG